MNYVHGDTILTVNHPRLQHREHAATLYTGGKPGEKLEWKEAPWMLLGPPVFAAAVCIVLGIWPNFAVRFFELAQMAAGVTTSAIAAGGSP